MNKEHWNTIIIDKNVDETLVKRVKRCDMKKIIYNNWCKWFSRK